MAKEKGTRGQPVQPERVDKDAPYPCMCKEGKGVRNFACPNYDNCLDRAAKGMWSGFTCRECCSYVQKEEDNPELRRVKRSTRPERGLKEAMNRGERMNRSCIL